MTTLRTDLEATPPFDFGLTASYRTRYSDDLCTERISDGVYYRICSVKGKTALISITSTGTIDRPQVRMEARGAKITSDDLPSLEWQANWLLGLDYDLAGFYAMAKEDPLLAGLVGRFRGLKPPREPDLFETLITTILGQQISAKVAVVMRQEMVRAYGQPLAFDDTTYYAFPTPERLADAGVEGLRRCKLSQRKAEYIHAISREVSDGDLDLEGLRDLGDEGVIGLLTERRGVGLWTAQWFLCHALGRFDVFPIGDLALLKTISRVYMDGRAVTPEELDAFSERWGLYRVPVITYLYAAIRQGIDLTRPLDKA
ncbi:MAG: DNA-3-methyladenine glycosylase 2 [Chloroflexi bacterium]|nr:DNA-3-methyladenine glycosylase 2 [Chloroflexota bacterium]